jgi:hypothetical protein
MNYMKKSMPVEIHLISYRDLEKGKHMLGFTQDYLRVGDVLIPKPTGGAVTEELPRFVIESKVVLLNDHEYGYVGSIAWYPSKVYPQYLKEGVPWIKECSMSPLELGSSQIPIPPQSQQLDKSEYCIPQSEYPYKVASLGDDVFEYPQDKLLFSQLISAKTEKLRSRIYKTKEKLKNLENQLKAYESIEL